MELSRLGRGDEAALERFLRAHADSSMFLRANARRAGLVDRGQRLQATYVAARPRRRETFFSVDVKDMQRATAFYVDALGASVAFASPRWSSLRIAGVRVGLALDPEHEASRTGLHFAVRELAAACADIERAGGRVVLPAVEVAPGVILAEVVDSEDNTFTLRQD